MTDASFYFQLPRRKSSGSVTSGSEDSDVEPSPPVVRRGRRSAIVDTKVGINFSLSLN